MIIGDTYVRVRMYASSRNHTRYHTSAQMRERDDLIISLDNWIISLIGRDLYVPVRIRRKCNLIAHAN